MKSSRERQVCQEKAETSLLTREEGATGHSRMAEGSGGGVELGGARLLEATDVRWGTQFCPTGLPSKDSSARPGSGQGTKILEGRVSSPAERGGMEGDNSRPWEGSPRQGMELAPGLPRQSSSGSRICPLLASSGQAMAQVSDTWGPESHARKPNTLGPQPPTSSSYKQAGFLEEEAGPQSGAAGRLLPGRG